jgi:hypothetical protein
VSTLGGVVIGVVFEGDGFVWVKFAVLVHFLVDSGLVLFLYHVGCCCWIGCLVICCFSCWSDATL